ncbi:synaptotagmin-like protein 1 isoform X1 [Sinocyclocheilus grahami]|uniref:synaptotagmin-like protein 1 isoform X1 n=1 Tax=Sinocyclocheilus grahami TaxID=75366 RepID=UPI0007ACA696|nr:PREDICTED: synaptotagmin-like protein 1 isoform X1 [Sinocyclocheilus grahami]
MKQSKSALELIDLSFLSAEEEAAIRQVLLRDEDLKRLESGRVRKLRQSVPDFQQLKTLTGEWFEELRVKRYGLQTDVTAVVRSSMRWKKTAAHKPNPFLNEKEDHITPSTYSNPSADPRLIHPALSKESYHQYTDEDFMDGEASSAPRVAGRKEKLRAELNGNHVLNSTDPQDNSSEAQPKELSGDQTTVFPFLSAVQDTKPERGTTKHATNPEPGRKVSLPQVLSKDQSFEENWVKISLEPNAVKPMHDESNSVGPKQKEGKDASGDSADDRPVEMEKKTPKKNELLHNKTADISAVEDFKMSSPPSKPSVSDKTVQRYLDAHEDKEKIKKKSSNDHNLAKDTNNTSQVLAELSQDYLSMTDNGKLVHIGNAGEHVDTKHNDKTAVEPIRPAKPTSEDVAGLGQGSSEIKVEEDNAETEQGMKSDIVLSVLARAQKTRPPVLQKNTALEPKQETRDDMVPTIVIMPSESPDPTKMKGQKHGVSDLEALLEGSTSKTPSYTANARGCAVLIRDEGVDSDDDDTSLSSYGSDLSSRKGYSASALSLTDRTGSLLSVYSDAGDFGNVEVQGSVEFAVMYSPVGELIIMIEQCQDLAIADPRKQRTDPYVKTYLYPDKSRRSKRKTSIKKWTANPVYVESLRYKVKREELPDKTLNLSVWHNDSRGRNLFLGQVEISFKIWDWGHEALTWYNLQPKTSENQESQESNGLLSISLKYAPPESGGSKNSTGEIHVWLREAKELRRLKPQGVDSFVKCYILPDTRKKSRQKTRIVKKTQDPVYNHAMVYDGFKTGEVSEACCELTVWDHNTLANQFLGGLRLSLGTGQSYGKKVDWMDSMDEEIQIWKRMLANPNSWVEGELPLRSSMTPRK